MIRPIQISKSKKTKGLAYRDRIIENLKNPFLKIPQEKIKDLFYGVSCDLRGYPINERRFKTIIRTIKFNKKLIDIKIDEDALDSFMLAVIEAQLSINRAFNIRGEG